MILEELALDYVAQQWLIVDQFAFGISNTNPTSKPRPNTNAPKYKQAQEYHEDNAMKKIQSAIQKQMECQRQIDQQ